VQAIAQGSPMERSVSLAAASFEAEVAEQAPMLESDAVKGKLEGKGIAVEGSRG